MSSGEKSLLIVGLTSCEPCKELQEQIKKEEVVKELAEKHGVDASKVKIMYADVEGPEGDEARNICYSLDKFSSPQLIIEEKEGEKRRLCSLDDKLEKERCADYRTLPM